MIAEIQAINETNLQNIEQYSAISSRYDLLDTENQFTVFGQPKDDPLEIESTLASIEEKLGQFESEMKIELAYKN
jgi:hypothetical protein